MSEDGPDGARCSACGWEYPDPAAIAVTPGDQRTGCARCGSKGVNYRKVLTAEQNSSASLTAYKPPGATGDEAVRVIRGGSDPRVADANLSASRGLEDRIEGRASRKDDSELRAAQTLVEHLNADGAQWGQVELRRGREDGVDAVAYDGGQALRIQVTTPERAVWKQLASAAEVRRSDNTTERAVAAIKAAIEGKLLFAGTASIVLALDSTDSPSYALAGVADAFGAAHGQWASEAGYASIWLVGPVASLVHRIGGAVEDPTTPGVSPLRA
jgi:hypothetical protein